MFRSTSISVLAGGAAVFGLVWASRALFGRRSQSQAVPPAPVAVAHSNAQRDLHDLFDAGTADALEDEDIEEIEETDLDITVGPMEHLSAADQHYDAMDTEDLGSEWLLRATQSTPPEAWEEEQLREGTHVIGPRSDATDPREDAYGSDQESSPLEPYAEIHDEEVAPSVASNRANHT